MSRSFLFVPADSERKLARAADSDADALILDLEDSVQASAREAARDNAARFLSAGATADLWVRINPIATAAAVDDLQAVVPGAPAGIVLPKSEGAGDVDKLATLLDAMEQDAGFEAGQTRILPIATERPAALFGMHEYSMATSRLAGLTWGAEDLSAAVGASVSKDEDGRWTPPYELARSLCLFAAAAAAVPAIDTVYTDFRNADGLTDYAIAARRDGFEGMLAIHPDQVGIINKAFSPSDDEVRRAQRIVELFAENPDAGALAMDGVMIDRPHWIQAKRLLDAAEKYR